MPDYLIKAVSEQSFSIALLLFIAYLLWRTMRADMKEKEARIKALEEEFRSCIQKNQEDIKLLMRDAQQKNEKLVELMAHTTEVLEHNTLVLQKYLPENISLRHAAAR